MRLENKVAIVTGGASGFGRGIVERFLKEGAKVVIADINYEKAKQLEIALGPNCIAVKVDVCKKSDVDNMFDVTIKHFSEINILVQNAAIGMKPQPLVETSEDLFDKLFSTNVKSIYLGAVNTKGYRFVNKKRKSKNIISVEKARLKILKKL